MGVANNFFSQLGSTPYAQRVTMGYGADGGFQGPQGGSNYSNNPYQNANDAESGAGGGGDRPAFGAPLYAGGIGSGGGGTGGLTSMFSGNAEGGGQGGGWNATEGGLSPGQLGYGGSLGVVGGGVPGQGEADEFGNIADPTALGQSVDEFGNVTQESFDVSLANALSAIMNPMAAALNPARFGKRTSTFVGNAAGFDDYSDPESAFGTQTGTNAGTFGEVQRQADNPRGQGGGSGKRGGSSTSSGMGMSGKGPQGGKSNRGGSDRGSCFVAGTEVVMANGTTKLIEDVVIGDVLRGQDTENTVIKYDHPKLGNRGLLSFNGGQFFVTEEHPFYTKDGWKSVSPAALHDENLHMVVGELKPGDEILTADGDFLLIENIIEAEADPRTQLYNFFITGDNTYYADGYLVHNKGGGGAGSGGGVSCFVAGTKVLREDGTEDSIENIKIGDKLQGVDGSINIVQKYDRPLLTDRLLYSMNAGKPWFTSEHPFMTDDKQWKALEPHLTKLEMPSLEVSELKVGDKIIQSDGSTKELKEFEASTGAYNTQLYNFVLDNTRSYFANGNLVHNVK